MFPKNRIETRMVSKSSSERMLSIDALRGLLMAAMALDHAGWFLSIHRHGDEMWGGAIPQYESTFAFFTRFASHFCAPGFFFLMGMSMVLLQSARNKAGWDENQVRVFFVQRGLFFILLQFCVENPLWALAYHASLVPMLGYVGVLYGLGIAMIVSAGVLHWPSVRLLVIGILGIGVSEWLVPASHRFTEAFPYWQRLLLLSGETGFLSVYFPVFPWVFITLLGIPMGRWMKQNSKRAFQMLGGIGLLLLLCFALMRLSFPFGNLRPLESPRGWIDYLALVKYPPSFLFLCATLGIDFILLSGLSRLPLSSRIARIWITFGQAPFFFYLGHLLVFALMSLVLPKVELSGLYGLWLVAIALLYFPTRWFAKFKAGTVPTSFWRLL